MVSFSSNIIRFRVFLDLGKLQPEITPRLVDGLSYFNERLLGLALDRIQFSGYADILWIKPIVFLDQGQNLLINRRNHANGGNRGTPYSLVHRR
jgi:hypothetical protein